MNILIKNRKNGDLSMIKGKHDYDFRNRSYIATNLLTPTPNTAEFAGCSIDESWEIVAPISDSRLVRYFLGDLCNFLADAFGVCIRVRKVKDLSEYIASPAKRITDRPFFCYVEYGGSV